MKDNGFRMKHSDNMSFYMDRQDVAEHRWNYLREIDRYILMSPITGFNKCQVVRRSIGILHV